MNRGGFVQHLKLFPLAEFLIQKCQRYRQQHTTVLSLATLGDVTQIEMILIAKASKVGDITSL
jgi:hypothetical protein